MADERTENQEAPVTRQEAGLESGKAGNTPNDSVIEKPDEVLPGDNSPQDTAPTRSA